MPQQGRLSGKKIAILATDGVEQVELVEPRAALEQVGASTTLVSDKPGEIQAFKHHDEGDRLKVDLTVDRAHAADFDGLLLPGGVINPDALRTNRDAVRFVRDFVEADKPVAAICHGPWTLIEADAVRGRTLTSWPSLQTDIRNAGGTWVDKPVQQDQKLVTSRKPQDIPAFVDRFVAVLTEAVRESELDHMVEQTFPASDPLPSGMTPGGAGRPEAR
jgi:protease I